ncbi:hypothetical protein PSFL107428_04220 [Pseudoalteromonas maricaloris]
MKNLSLKVVKLKSLSKKEPLKQEVTPYIAGGTDVPKDPITSHCSDICSSACSWRGC